MYGRGSIFPSFAVLIPFIIIKILATVTTQPRPMMEPAMLATALTTARSKPCFAWYMAKGSSRRKSIGKSQSHHIYDSIPIQRLVSFVSYTPVERLPGA